MSSPPFSGSIREHIGGSVAGTAVEIVFRNEFDDRILQILSVYVRLITGSTAGGRLVMLRVLDVKGNTLGNAFPSIDQAASLTMYTTFTPMCKSAYTFAGWKMSPVPCEVIPPKGYAAVLIDGGLAEDSYYVRANARIVRVKTNV